MSPLTLSLLAQIVQVLMSAAASLPAVVEAGKTTIKLLQSNTDPTATEEADIRAALDAAHAALQAG